MRIPVRGGGTDLFALLEAQLLSNGLALLGGSLLLLLARAAKHLKNQYIIVF